LQLGIADYNKINPLILKQIEIKFLYQHSQIVNEDFGEFPRNLVQLKSSLATEKIIAAHHSRVLKLKSTTHALALTPYLTTSQDSDSASDLLPDCS
jgi:hypothetical protein